MKKILSTLLVAVCLFMAMPAQAKFHFGLKGGLDVSKVQFSSDLFKGDNATGFFIGPMAEFTLPVVGLGIDAAALYSQSGLKIKGSEDTEKLKSIEVPVNLKWSVGLGSALGVYLAAGPQFGFNIDNGFDKLMDTKTCAVSVNVGVGVKLLSHLQIGVNYNIGASKLAELVPDEVGEYISAPNLRKNSWQVSAAYLF